MTDLQCVVFLSLSVSLSLCLCLRPAWGPWGRIDPDADPLSPGFLTNSCRSLLAAAYLTSSATTLLWGTDRNNNIESVSSLIVTRPWEVDPVAFSARTKPETGLSSGERLVCRITCSIRNYRTYTAHSESRVYALIFLSTPILSRKNPICSNRGNHRHQQGRSARSLGRTLVQRTGRTRIDENERRGNANHHRELSLTERAQRPLLPSFSPSMCMCLCLSPLPRLSNPRSSQVISGDGPQCDIGPNQILYIFCTARVQEWASYNQITAEP